VFATGFQSSSRGVIACGSLARQVRAVPNASELAIPVGTIVVGPGSVTVGTPIASSKMPPASLTRWGGLIAGVPNAAADAMPAALIVRPSSAVPNASALPMPDGRIA
jgi:hypothetical protein